MNQIMKSSKIILLSGIFVIGLSCGYAQLGGDPTTPPTGAPTATMRTLDQVEARIPLVDGAPGVVQESNGGFTISQSGSYFLTGNLALTSGDGIIINVDNVTLDLNGFTISKAVASAIGSGVVVTGSNVTITNGFIISDYELTSDTITGKGFLSAVDLELSSKNVRLSHLTVEGCGAYVNDVSVESIDSCVGRYNKRGFFAERVTNTSSMNVELIAISARIVENTSASSFKDVAISCSGSVVNSRGTSDSDLYPAITGVTVSHSVGENTDAGSGISVSNGTVSNSRGISDSGTGIFVIAGSVSNSYGQSRVGTGIVVSTGMVSYSYAEVSSRPDPAIICDIAIACVVKSTNTITAGDEYHSVTP